MPYYRPIKTIASIAGLPGVGSGGGVVVIVSETKPDTRDNGAPLQEGDFWYQPNQELTYIFADGEWQVIGSNVDYSGDFIIDGGDSLGHGFIDNYPNDGSGPGIGINTTADLPLDFFAEKFGADVRVTDLPSIDNLVYQSDANAWYLEAILLHHSAIETVEDDIQDLYQLGSGIQFNTTAPITVERVEQKVTHGFDMRKLTSIN